MADTEALLPLPIIILDKELTLFKQKGLRLFTTLRLVR